MSPALKTSTPKSNAAFFRGSYLWIVVAALVLSMILYWVFRAPEKITAIEGEGAPDLAAQAELAAENVSGVQPPSFQQISEYQEGGRFGLRLSGGAEPDGVVVLTDKGKRLRQVRVNEQGQWNVTIDAESRDIESGLMVITAELFLVENSPSVQSEETIIRLFPDSEERSLIMATAPGRPSRLIQSPFGDVPRSGPLSLTVIDYDHSGGVIITGTSSIPGRIRIYAQDAVIGEPGVGVSGRWNYIAGRMLPPGEIEIRAELIAAQGVPEAPEGPISITVPFTVLPPLEAEESDGALKVNLEPKQWQVRRTLIGGGGQTTVIFSPEMVDEKQTEDLAAK